MPSVHVNGIDLHYEMEGEGDPVMLIVGLGGAGRGWGPQLSLFPEGFTTIVPDHRGSGASSKPADGYTMEAHATDMAEALRALAVGPAHIVGSSTGGAIAQLMALDHPDVVRSITLVSSWARSDDFFRHQFAVRKEVLQRLGGRAYSEASALFLYSPEFFRDHYDQVRAWCDESGAATDPELMSKRIDMVLAFDSLDRLGGVGCPTLVLVGAQDNCTPPHLSRQLAERIPGAQLRVLEGGHLIYKERPELFHRTVVEFLRSV